VAHVCLGLANVGPGLRLESVDMAGTHISKTARCGPLANLFFAIINLEMSVQEKKRDWFDLGAKAYSQACPGIYAAPTYVCPICRKPFTVEALDDGRLSKEHVPPQSVGGHELLLALHHPHGGCPILTFFARVGGDAAGATLVRSTPPVVYAVVVPALFAYAKDGAPASVVASAV